MKKLSCFLVCLALSVATASFPFAHAQTVDGGWEQVLSPPGCQTMDIVTYKDTVLIRDWYSADRGETWQRYTLPESLYERSIRFYRAFGRTWGFARHSYYGDCELWRLNPESMTWTMIADRHNAIHILVRGDSVMIPCGNAVCLSTDPSGHDWWQLNTGIPSGQEPYAWAVFKGESICVTLYGTLHRFLKTKWELFGRVPGAGGVVVRAVAANDEYLFIALQNGDLLKSRNGVDWESEPVDYRWDIWVGIFARGQLVVTGGASALHISTDGGESFSEERFGLDRIVVHDAECLEDRLFVSVNGLGVMMTDDSGRTWQQADIPGLQVHDLVRHRGSFFATNGGSPGLYRLDSADWTFLHAGVFGNPASYEEADLHVHDDVLFFAPKFAGSWRSTDMGEHWTRITSCDPYDEVKFTSAGPFLFAATQGNIGRSIDLGDSMTWSSFFDVYPDGVREFRGVLYFCGRAVMSSRDQGMSWVHDRAGLPGESVYVSHADSGGVYLGHTKYWVYRKTDPDQPWEHVGISPPDTSSVMTLYAHDGCIFAAGYNTHLHMYDPATGTWNRWDDGLPDSRGARMLGAFDGWLYGSPPSGGLWRRPLPVTTGIDTPTPAASSLQLHIHPQPADAFVDLSIAGHHGAGAVRVVDMLGRTVYDHRISAVSSNLRIITTTWVPGLYLVDVVIGDARRQGKIVLR
jgi:hypothetical protein